MFWLFFCCQNNAKKWLKAGWRWNHSWCLEKLNIHLIRINFPPNPTAHPTAAFLLAGYKDQKNDPFSLIFLKNDDVIALLCKPQCTLKVFSSWRETFIAPPLAWLKYCRTVTVVCVFLWVTLSLPSCLRWEWFRKTAASQIFSFSSSGSLLAASSNKMTSTTLDRSRFHPEGTRGREEKGWTEEETEGGVLFLSPAAKHTASHYILL